jgi:Tfp pilus assembly protein PilF
MGMRYVKQKEYNKALQMMEHALKIDPKHEQASRKAKQLKAHMEKHTVNTPFEEHNPLL